MIFKSAHLDLIRFIDFDKLFYLLYFLILQHFKMDNIESGDMGTIKWKWPLLSMFSTLNFLHTLCVCVCV